ncbi:CPBP family intramembrane glutamic endopeptidase [Planobispora siamensis]|uniref:CAAX prenyl protease 2/Lysostaphin resistance protein A-like domain-containing protein n=1 Tax=Planobispora siamensis TaxID=936338 RepID=A0A8J3WPY9_9ACTN|nr:CPBP family intramembrane glutamic endopeptidase [Planobispora siamensis]GIH97475.1 hypothetical protein Psi01_81050 [Planobispora siamensis]
MAEATTSHSDPRSEVSPPPDARRVGVWQFLVLAVIYLIIVQGMSAILMVGQGIAHGAPTTNDHLIRTIVLPVGLATAFTLVVVGYLGAWDEVFVDRRPVRNWLIAIPIILLVTVAVITNYPGLAAKGLDFTLLLLVATLMVGFGEELMFRGIGVLAFRSGGHSEFRVGLWTTLIFGLAHGTNIFTAGPQALIQVVATSGTGLVFYLIRRRAGALVAAMAAHGLWDFGVLSSQIDPDQPWPLVNGAAVALAVMLLLVLILRRRVAPEPPAAEPESSRNTGELA